MNILVTGGTGFIGGELIKSLINNGHNVKALVRPDSILNFGNEVCIFRGQLEDQRTLDGIEESIEAVIHCAGALGKWGMDKSIIYNINVNGSMNILECFKAIKLKRFVHVSAGGVTGPLNGVIASENYKCNPATLYEKSKLVAEQKMIAFAHNHYIPLSVARPTFTYGPTDTHKLGLFKAINKGRFVLVNGGKSVNHPVYIADAVQGIRLVLDKGKNGEVYIIGGDRPVTKKELAYTIADALNVARPRISIPRWLASTGAFWCETIGSLLNFEPILTKSRVSILADDFGFSIQKAMNDLGYVPQLNLEEGIAKTVEHYKKNSLL